MTKPKKNTIKKCVLNCKTDNKLFSFPDQPEACRVWLKMLGLSGTPLCRSEMHVCLNHFSSRQLSDNGRTITPISIPDKNIPGRENPPEPEPEIKAVRPPSKKANNNLADTQHNTKKYSMVTSDSSKCYLKCKTYKSLHRFPHDLTSFNIWIGKLDLPETVKLNRTASLCDNHFSPAMRTSKTISRCAVPDIYLPSQCKFIDEFEDPLDESIIQSTYDEIMGSVGSPEPIVLEPTPAEILTNTNSADSPTKPEDTPVAIRTDLGTKSEVVCPENYKNGFLECVLKCPDSKTLYRFPNVESRRQKWLTQIGLTHCFCNTRICNRHFSEKMLSKHRLTNSSYPDINLPEPLPSRIRVASLPLQDEVRPVCVQELPEDIPSLNVLTDNTEINIVNKTKYVKYTVDKRIPKRERSVQVGVEDLIEKVSIAILADEDFDDDGKLEIVENINFVEQPDLACTKFKSQVFPSKSKDMFECLKCGEISVDQDSSRRHFNLHSELSLLCSYCGRIFVNEIKLKLHEMKVHSMEFKQLVRCPKVNCKKAFYSRKNLDQHLDEHVKPSRHFCCNCGRLFFSSLKLKCHLMVCKPRKWKSRIK